MNKILLAGVVILLTVMQTMASQMRFDKDGTFKIVQFTDCHIDPAKPGFKTTLETISVVTKKEQPDLLIFSGDIVTGRPAEEGWHSLIKLVKKLNVRFAVIMGNHDPEYCTKDSIYYWLEQSRLYVGERGPVELTGVGNSYLPIYGKGITPQALIYMMDSGDYGRKEWGSTYAWVGYDQVAWYRRSSQAFTKLNGGNPIPSLMYLHIPLPEYWEVVNSGKFEGSYHENEVCSPSVNSGLFLSMLEMGDVMGVFAGHDHDNDFLGLNRGIALAQGRVTGTDAYGSMVRGARVVVLHQGKSSFDTWIRTREGVEQKYTYTR